MELRDYINPEEGDERRYIFHPVKVQKRADDEEGVEFFTIEGIAAKVNSRTSLGWLDEIIEPGAFDDCLKDDVRCLFNHDPNLILARTVSSTLELFLTTEGHLAYRYTTPNRSYALDLQDSIDKGDVTQSSFAFRIKEQSWVWAEEGSSENDLRKIIKMERLYDVAPVTYPAYEDTTVAKRSFDHLRKEKKENKNSESSTSFDEFDAQLMFNKNKV